MSLPRVSRSLRWTTIAAVSAVGVAAWAQSQPKFPTPLPVPKSAPAETPATPPPGATPAAPATSTSTPGGPRDPFEPLVRKPEPGQERRVQEVAALKLVGIIWDTKDPEAMRALVETPDGLGYYLRLNEEKFGAKVVALERDRVRFVIRDQVPGAGTVERTVELRLPKPDAQ
jgi:hypothetical protein